MRGVCLGSSPRMRGALRQAAQAPVDLGIIPADAGSTAPRTAPARRAGDHPRGCGEHGHDSSWVRFVWGSSPRMRGAPPPRPPRGQWQGIIPADAGSTRPPREGWSSGRDHPRGCGEHLATDLVPYTFQGSSPRMRGAPRRARQHKHRPGIIPADAGSTKLSSPGRSPAGDHPRACGEHVVHDSERIAAGRIIPADAGSTLAPSRPSSRRRDHPRGCGEHVPSE